MEIDNERHTKLGFFSDSPRRPTRTSILAMPSTSSGAKTPCMTLLRRKTTTNMRPCLLQGMPWVNIHGKATTSLGLFYVLSRIGPSLLNPSTGKQQTKTSMSMSEHEREPFVVGLSIDPPLKPLEDTKGKGRDFMEDKTDDFNKDQDSDSMDVA
jgi:hypothetical protein